ncbi:MAG: alpha/beta fold hydrolase, partial [Rubrivivax sp.]
MPTIQVPSASGDSVQLHYVDEGEGRPIVLLHGWPLSHRMWAPQISALKSVGFRVIAYDRRGFGESGKPAQGYDYDTLAADLNALLESLDIQDATLVGFSMG